MKHRPSTVVVFVPTQYSALIEAGASVAQALRSNYLSELTSAAAAAARMVDAVLSLTAALATHAEPQADDAETAKESGR
jgi:hypothetical protein